MNDEYLWDGSGDADPDVEKLEGLLGRYRSERPAPELPQTPVVPFRPRRPVLLPFAIVAAAAAVVLTLGLGLWMRSFVTSPAVDGGAPRVASTGGGTEVSAPPGPVPPPAAGAASVRGGAPRIHHVRDAHGPRKTGAAQPTAPPAEAEPKVTPLVDVATAGHIEQAELLLRSFRNASAGDDEDAVAEVAFDSKQSRELLDRSFRNASAGDDEDAVAEVAFDSKQSRELLDRNTLLRRNAEAKKNLPVGQLLGDLEPFLLDIANLGDKPSREDVREIWQRLDRREMLSDLELYSINRPTQGF